MRRRVRARPMISMLGLLSGLAVCTDACVPRGQIMLIVTTDMAPGEDIDEIEIKVNDEVAGNVYFGAGSGSTGELPAELGIVTGDAQEDITIEVIARLGGADRQHKIVRPITPDYGLSQVHVHLPFLCETGASFCAANDLVCGNDGGCTVDAAPEPDELPAAGAFADASCLDVVSCFEGAGSLADLDVSDCTIAGPAAGVNVALLTAFPTVNADGVETVQKGSGLCGANLCYVVLEDTALTDAGADRVQLPSTICAQIASGRLLGVVTTPVTKDCPKKKLDTISNGWWSTICRDERPPAFTSPWTSTGVINIRSLHAAVTTGDGDLMLIGGATTEPGDESPSKATTSVNVFDHQKKAWGQAPGMNENRAAHTATSTWRDDGLEIILVAGGTPDLDPAVGAAIPMDTFETYLVNSDAPGFELKDAALMKEPRYFHQAADFVLNGKHRVLVTGGVINSAGTATRSAERFFPSESDPAFDPGPATDDMEYPRAGHTMTLLNGGELLVVGGGSALNGKALSDLTRSAELYLPAQNTFETLDDADGQWLRQARGFHTATLLLTSGHVLVAGGQGENGEPLATVEIFEPITRKWSCAPPMSYPRFKHTATVLPGSSGRVLVVGGVTPLGTSAPAEIYDHATSTWTIMGVPDVVPRAGHTATGFLGGVLVAGGAGVKPVSAFENEITEINSTWLFRAPDTFQPTKVSSGDGCGGGDPGTGSDGGGEPPDPPAKVDFHGSGCAATPGASRIDCHVPSAPTPTGAAPWAFLVLALAARRRRPS
jgi:MYXO-CTERM domain-containing protein